MLIFILFFLEMCRYCLPNNNIKEKSNLFWKNYSDHVIEFLHKIRQSNNFTDVTLVCDDKKQFRAHKIVLSACSSVFKCIISDLPQNSSVIYLRGIQHQEMESILEFMYLGVATFYQERMNEFLNVAKNLEIREISKDVDFDDENVSNEEPKTPDHEEDTEDIELQTDTNSERNASSAKIMEIVDPSQYKRTLEGKFVCDQCERKFTHKYNLIRHIQISHVGVKYACNQCDYQASQQSGLTYHIQSKHQGVKYACNQCDYQASHQTALTYHIQSKHQGVMYACDQCGQQYKRKYDLNSHINSKHQR